MGYVAHGVKHIVCVQQFIDKIHSCVWGGHLQSLMGSDLIVVK